MKGQLRETGIDVLGAVPWGTHICLFYDTSQDLLDTLVSYFKAGLGPHEKEGIATDSDFLKI